MALYNMQKDNNFVFKNNQDRLGISYLSKHLSYVKKSHFLASPVKVVFCALSPFKKWWRCKHIYTFYRQHTHKLS